MEEKVKRYQVTIYLDKETHRKIKVMATNRYLTMTKIVEEWIQKAYEQEEKNGK